VGELIISGLKGNSSDGRTEALPSGRLCERTSRPSLGESTSRLFFRRVKLWAQKKRSTDEVDSDDHAF
jgi:hypothetical protein